MHTCGYAPQIPFIFSIFCEIKFTLFDFSSVFATFTITIQNQFKFYLLKVNIYTHLQAQRDGESYIDRGMGHKNIGEIKVKQ
jgi:hypothetical protein